MRDSEDSGTRDSENYGGVLGLEREAVRLHDPTPLWAELYRQEEGRLRAALGALLVDIQHYGSTAVPGIRAKPILDILVGIARLGDGPLCVAPLEALGYDYAPQAGIPGDYTFGRGERRTHLVHVVEYGGANWRQCLHFRDALRGDPALAREYEGLKGALARRSGRSRAEYTEGKTAFIRRVTSGA